MSLVCIIGSGPAALSAGLYLSRADLNVYLFEGFKPGGLLMTTDVIENYPGFVGDAYDLIDTMYKQNTEYGTKIIPEQVIEITKKSNKFEITTNSRKYIFDAVIIATGSKSKMLGIKGEDEFWGKGVSVCAVCEGSLPRFRNRGVLVVGGGDSAISEALFLSKFSDVTLIHRRDTLKASRALVKSLEKNSKISIYMNTQLKEIHGNQVDGVTHVSLSVNGKPISLNVRGVFVAIGHHPNSEVFKDLVLTDSEGYIVTQDTKTNVKGVFACGDVQDKKYRQAIVAAGNGCVAALECIKYLELI